MYVKPFRLAYTDSHAIIAVTSQELKAYAVENLSLYGDYESDTLIPKSLCWRSEGKDAEHHILSATNLLSGELESGVVLEPKDFSGEQLRIVVPLSKPLITKPTDSCLWTSDWYYEFSVKTFYHKTACDASYDLEPSDLKKLDYHFCPNCGRKIEMGKVGANG